MEGDFGGWADVSFSSIINDDMFYTSAVCTIRWRLERGVHAN